MDASELKSWYIDVFKDFEKYLNGEKLSPVHSLRRRAIEKFSELNFPDLHQEEWRFTDVSPILRHTFSPARPGELRGLIKDKLSHFLFGGMQSHLVVFVNGFYDHRLSSILDLPRGAFVGSLSKAFEEGRESVLQNVSMCADTGENSFTALNTSFVQDGAFVSLPAGVVLEHPVHLLFISTGSDNLIVQPRNLVITGEDSQLRFIEHYVSIGAGVYFTNAVTEINAGMNSVIDAVKVQSENEAAYHVATTAVALSSGASFDCHNIALGASIYRHNLNVMLKGEGSNTNLEGLYLTKSQQLSDTHTMIDHSSPRCTSQEHFKGILDDKSRGVFNGKILVRKGAQQTNSYQENRNIILSDEAKVDTKPQLEIFADDVKCSHGATVGQLSKESVFYLTSRGIGEEQAKLMLIYAFANDVLKNVKESEVRSELEGILSARILKGD